MRERTDSTVVPAAAVVRRGDGGARRGRRLQGESSEATTIDDVLLGPRGVQGAHRMAAVKQPHPRKSSSSASWAAGKDEGGAGRWPRGSSSGSSTTDERARARARRAHLQLLSSGRGRPSSGAGRSGLVGPPRWTLLAGPGSAGPLSGGRPRGWGDREREGPPPRWADHMAGPGLRRRTRRSPWERALRVRSAPWAASRVEFLRALSPVGGRSTSSLAPRQSCRLMPGSPPEGGRPPGLAAMQGVPKA